MLAISLTVFSANLHPTDAPKIKRQKLIDASGNLYVAISVICNNPLANNVPDKSAAGILILSKTKIKIIEAIITKLNQEMYSGKIVTEITKHTKFFKAEDYHQNYEKRNPNQGYVRAVSIPRLNKFKNKFPELLKKEAQ